MKNLRYFASIALVLLLTSLTEVSAREFTSRDRVNYAERTLKILDEKIDRGWTADEAVEMRALAQQILAEPAGTNEPLSKEAQNEAKEMRAFLVDMRLVCDVRRPIGSNRPVRICLTQRQMAKNQREPQEGLRSMQGRYSPTRQ